MSESKKVDVNHFQTNFSTAFLRKITR